MKLRIVFPLLLGLSLSVAQTTLLEEAFTDGELNNRPSWDRFFDSTLITVDSTRYVSPPFSCKIATVNQRSAIETFSNIFSSAIPFEITLNVYVESCEEEGIPLGLRGNASVLFLFLLPNGRIQLTVLKSRTEWIPANIEVPAGYSLRRWQAFKIVYDGAGLTKLFIDGVEKGSVVQPYVDEPSILQMGNKYLPHTSTFYVDDLRITTTAARGSPAKVYFVLCSDTDTWDGMDVNRYANFLRFGLFSSPTGNAAKVIQPAFRDKIRDANNNPLVLTWFMLEGSIVAKNANPEVRHPWISNTEMLRRYHDATLKQVKDEIAFHYHNWVWSDPDQDGQYHWNQTTDFATYRDDFMQTVGHLIVDGNFMPTSFRSGWHYMDNAWQCLLDSLIPYRLENASPNKHNDTTEPIDNIYDWSQAPLTWVPYHPDPNNYQLPGSLKGWETRCVSMKNLSTTLLAAPFMRALAGEPQVVTIWSHLAENDFPQQILAVDSIIHRTAQYFPGVVFEYETATGAMQKWRDVTDTSAPRIRASLSVQAKGREIFIGVDEPIWQVAPLVFLKGTSDSLVQVVPQPVQNLSWKVSLGNRDSTYREAWIAVTDTSGNSSVQTVVLNPLAPTAVGGAASHAPTFRLEDAYPNPFNPSTHIRYEIPRDLFVRIAIYDILGREVQTLVAQDMNRGAYLISFDASGLQSGMYFYRMTAGEFNDVKKLIYIQ